MGISIRPKHDYVVLRRLEDKQTGIIVKPASAKEEKSLRCNVVAVGPGRVTDEGVLVEPQARKGETVLVASKYSGTELELDGEKFLLVRDPDIAAVLE